jgi:Transcriptional regulator PadR-like family
MVKATDLVQGTLDLLDLKHGWAIAKKVQQISCEALLIQPGSLYPALPHLEKQGWIKAKWHEIHVEIPAEGDPEVRTKALSETRAGHSRTVGR